ncbi:maleylpyruvate isomerase family mycothiol-dependent enzyme [Aquihabitans sp. McL0605]|uniref:maleylpyruvate isomerase family mycothiol-dependent enzyme n=1 Tax=Aquihabitans sp. McL0605 TaxID=3415671 RepID=UPI003CEF2F72
MTVSDRITALETSVARLRAIVEPLDAAQLARPAYPSEWTLADALSHLGSGATIMKQNIEAHLAGTETPADFNQGVWDLWNAKAPEDQAADSLAADQALFDRIASLADEQRAAFSLPLGPMTLDFDSALALRLSEHALHTWDVEVGLDPSATIPGDVAAHVIDKLDIVLRFGAKPDGVVRSLAVETTDPQADLVLATSADEASLGAGQPTGAPDLLIPTEALIRLVYGRLDPDHVPAGVDEAVIAGLRPVFPGI